MKLRRRLFGLIAIVLLAPVAATCSPQAEATDADVAGEATSDDASFPLSAKGAWTMERLLALDHESTVALWKTLPATGMAVDEIRKLDEGVYLGVGTTATEDGGRSAPGHFALVGPTDEWVGAEE